VRNEPRAPLQGAHQSHAAAHRQGHELRGALRLRHGQMHRAWEVPGSLGELRHGGWLQRSRQLSFSQLHRVQVVPLPRGGVVQLAGQLWQHGVEPGRRRLQGRAGRRSLPPRSDPHRGRQLHLQLRGGRRDLAG
ncbi:unnamed protein product, partial [Polarella glacialis]